MKLLTYPLHGVTFAIDRNDHIIQIIIIPAYRPRQRL